MHQFLQPGVTPHPTFALPPQIPNTFEHGLLSNYAEGLKPAKSRSNDDHRFPSKMSESDTTSELKMERPDPLAGSLDSIKQQLHSKVEAWTPLWSESWIPWSRVPETFRKNWYLGLTAFGGPPVHFQILHKKFVQKEKWIDEQLFQEVFALSQALPGSSSTKMLFCINYIHGGLVSGFASFFVWSLPGAIGMYGLSLGVSRIGDKLPFAVYALLSGLNGATVGIIALAAMQLAQMAVTDRLTRGIVGFIGAAGICYTGIWYYPALMIISGVATLIWDFRLVQRLVACVLRRKQSSEQHMKARKAAPAIQTELAAIRSLDDDDLQRFIWTRRVYIGDIESANPGSLGGGSIHTQSSEDIHKVIEMRVLTWKIGAFILIAFALSFVAIMVLRNFLTSPRGLHLFQNLYLAGTIIFGGGPVVIPLLREYVVSEGWVSQRDFLLGLAIIQAFPGPNFNFAVYLGALAMAGTGIPTIVGALIAFVAIYLPGIMVVTGVMGLWKILRSQRWLLSFLRGVNAGAVGLVFTAVYKLWQIGFVQFKTPSGEPLGDYPWWVVITAASFVGGAWFNLRAPFAIMMGGIMGLAWYGAVGHKTCSFVDNAPGCIYDPTPPPELIEILSNVTKTAVWGYQVTSGTQISY